MEELSRLAPEDVFRLAITRSPYSTKEVSARLGWSDSFLRRVTADDKYFPSFVDIPRFCEAVGNELVIDWQRAQVRYKKAQEPDVTPDYLRDQVVGLSSQFGDVATKVKEAVADNKLTKKELRGILKEVLELVNFGMTLSGALRDADKKVARNG